MNLMLLRSLAAAGATALLLTGCSDGGNPANGNETGTEDPAFAEMTSWDACEVLDGLQPIADEVGIVGWGSATAEGGEPGTREYGNTWDPDAVGCGNLVNLGENEGLGASGELGVGIIPAESEDQAASLYQERSESSSAAGADGEQFAETAVSGPWDEGVLYFWGGVEDSPTTHLIARDGQWLFFFELEHTLDFGLRNGGEPSLAFTEEGLHQWLVDTYLPEVNQTVNDKLAEVQ